MKYILAIRVPRFVDKKAMNNLTNFSDNRKDYNIQPSIHLHHTTVVDKIPRSGLY